MSDMTSISRCVCKVAFMDRLPTEECMHKLPRIGNDISFLHHVTKFLATVKKHRVSRGEELTICMCRS